MSLNFILDQNENPDIWTNLLVNSIQTNVPIENTDASKIQGRDVADVDPADTEVLTWSSSTMQWEPAPGGGGGGGSPIITPGKKSFYWNISGGSDANDGETPGTPVQTWARLVQVAQPFYYEEIELVLDEDQIYQPDRTIDPNNPNETYVDLTVFNCSKLKFIGNNAPIMTATPISSVDWDPVSGRTLTGNAFKTYTFSPPLPETPFATTIVRYNDVVSGSKYGVTGPDTDEEFVNVFNNKSGEMSFYDFGVFPILDFGEANDNKSQFLINAMLEIERCTMNGGKSKNGNTWYMYGCGNDSGITDDNVVMNGCTYNNDDIVGGKYINCYLNNNQDVDTGGANVLPVNVYNSYCTRISGGPGFVAEGCIIDIVLNQDYGGGILKNCIITQQVSLTQSSIQNWEWDNVELDNVNFLMTDKANIVCKLGSTASTVNSFDISDSSLSLSGGGIIYTGTAPFQVTSSTLDFINNTSFSAPNIVASGTCIIATDSTISNLNWSQTYTNDQYAIHLLSSKVISNNTSITKSGGSRAIFLLEGVSVFVSNTLNCSNILGSIFDLRDSSQLITGFTVTNGTGPNIIDRGLGVPTSPFAWDDWTTLPLLPVTANLTLIGRG